MLRYLTAGESHGRALLAVLEGLPAGLKLDTARINQELKRRQQGYGRGKRMRIEQDKIDIVAGLRKGLTIGSPIGILITNKDYSIEKMPGLLCPRPGHADLSGLLKYGFSNIRNVIERASARETAVRVAIGAICKIFLDVFDIRINSRVIQIHGEEDKARMRLIIDEARKRRDTVGGVFEVVARGVIPGLGTYAHWEGRLDARLAQAVMSIPGIKAVEIGLGFGYAQRYGSEAHDQIYYSRVKGFYRRSNNAGGIEGGISNGEEIVIRACMKPISTLMKPLDSVNVNTKRRARASVERADICVVEAAGVIAESVTAFELVRAFLEKFGSDTMEDIKINFQNYLRRLKR